MPMGQRLKTTVIMCSLLARWPATQGASSPLRLSSETTISVWRNPIVSGVTEICQSHGRVIVIEDDLLVAPELLQFMNLGLARYEEEERDLQVTGYAFPAHNAEAPGAFFLPIVSCWGWATWGRAWKKFDCSLSLLPVLSRDSVVRRRFNVDDTYDYYTMACNQRDGKISSWGICWQMSLFANDGLVLYPRRSLVMNAGFDGSGTHNMTGDGLQRPLDPQRFNLNRLEWPTAIETDSDAYDDVKRLLSAHKPGAIRKLARWLRT